jgi:hypothetical protein
MCLGLLKPKVGNQPSFTEKYQISTKPSQNAGMEIPRRLTRMASPSQIVLRFTAAITPRGSPRQRKITVAAVVNSMVVPYLVLSS